MGRSKKSIWPKTVNIWWCPDCNVPLLREECSKCGSTGFKIKLAEPGDARPAFKHDVEKLEQCIIESFQSLKPFKTIFRDKFILINKASYLDEMKEVYVDGVRVGHLYYDPINLKWKFRLDREGAVKLVECREVEVVEVGEEWKKRKVLTTSRSFDKSLQVVLSSKGKIVGVAETGEHGKLKILKRFRHSHETRITTEKNATLEDVLKANDYSLYVEEARAKKFLYVMSTKVDKPLVVSYSGGKDSLSSLYLTLDVGLNPTLLFNNTGIELPETVASVDRACEKFGLELVTAEAGDSFWHAVEKLGPPGRDYRWCCKVTKLVPLARTVNSKWPSGALNVVGQRAYESIDRARSPRVWRNKYVPSLLSISPIQEWSQLQVWLYIYKAKLQDLINPLYSRGFDRIGCYMCPACRLSEFEVVSNVHRELWSKWLKVLEKWRVKLKLPRAWITYGLWRWLTPSNAKLNIARKANVKLPSWEDTYKLWIKPTISSVELTGRSCKVKLSTSLDLEILKLQHPILGEVVESDEDKLEIVSRDGKYLYYFDRTGHIRVRFEGGNCLEGLVDSLKVYYRGIFCVKCTSCTIWCPTGAVREVGPHRLSIVEGKCRSCKICLEVCPISDVVVEKIVTSQILRNPKAWKRSSKRKREEVVKILAKTSSTLQASECKVEKQL